MTDLLSGGAVVPEGTVTFLLTDVERVHRSGGSRSPTPWPPPSPATTSCSTRPSGLTAASDPSSRARATASSPPSAVPPTRCSAAVDAQRALQAEAWPTGSPLRVRMAIHTGETRLRDEGNYVGGSIVRTARLRAIAHGGQVLVSSATHDLVVDELPAPVELLDLGTHRLKDLARPEHVWQLAHPELESEFPPLRVARQRPEQPARLPVHVHRPLRRDRHHRPARARQPPRQPHGSGRGGQDPAGPAGRRRARRGLPRRRVVGRPRRGAGPDAARVRHQPGRTARRGPRRPPAAGSTRRLAGQRVLLILDNCEHLADGCAEAAAEILRGCPEVAILATSRAPLNVPGELSWRVPPLGLRSEAEASLEAVASSDAVRLFVDRATRARRDFRLTDENVGRRRGHLRPPRRHPAGHRAGRGALPGAVAGPAPRRARRLAGGARWWPAHRR